jgi:hypothetical protein
MVEYFAPEQVGDTRFKTPEGFLLCLNVPIARTGHMLYTERDLPGFKAGKDGMIHVERGPDDLFAPSVFGSIIGKAITLNHPTDAPLLTPKTYNLSSQGAILNPRRGEGDMQDCLVADLLVQQEESITAVDNGVVQVSLGYDAKYEEVRPGVLRQFGILGNHLAIVNEGRCGPRCAVGDAAPSVCACGKGGACGCDIIFNGEDNMSKRAQLLATIDSALSTVMGGDPDEKTEVKPGKDEAPVVKAEGGDTHVHVHLPGNTDAPVAAPINDKAARDRGMRDRLTKMRDRKGMRDKKTKDNDEDQMDPAMNDKRTKDATAGIDPTTSAAPDAAGEGDDDILTQILDALDSLAGRIETLEGASTTAPASTDAKADANMSIEEAEKKTTDADAENITGAAEKMDVGKTPPAAESLDKRATRDAVGRVRDRDSTHLAAEMADTVARAAILVPGLSTPTFDAKQTATMTLGSLCGFRRRAMVAALATTDGKASVEGFFPNRAALDGASCDTVRVAFLATTDAAKHRNNGIYRNLAAPGGPTKPIGASLPGNPKTPAERNAENRARFGLKV